MSSNTYEISPQQVANTFHRDGAILVPDLVPQPLVQAMADDFERILAEGGENVFYQADGATPRAIYGLHQRGGPWRELLELPQLTDILEAVFGEPYYIFQWKINPKAPNGGEKWEWHRDFIYWNTLDGVPEPQAINVAVFLSDVTVESGPTLVVRGSHRVPPSERELAMVPSGSAAEDADGDMSAFAAAEIPYSVPEDEVAALGAEHGMIEATGGRGSTFLFHSNVIHGSLPNMSPAPRVVTFLTLNPVSNAPHRASLRADFMVNSPKQQ